MFSSYTGFSRLPSATIAVFAVALLALATVAQAQPDGEALTESDGSAVRYNLSAGVSHLFDADIDDGGDFSLTRFNLNGSVWHRYDFGLSVSASLGYGLDAYDFSGDDGFGDPWDEVHTVPIRLAVGYPLNREWRVFGGPLLSFSAEGGADWGDAFTAGGMAGMGWRPSDTFHLSFGVVVLDQIEDDVVVFPTIGFDWDFQDDWTLRSGVFDVGSRGGYGLELAWDATEKLELALGGQFQTRRFRLDDDGVAPDGIGEHFYYPVYLRGTWSATERLDAYLIAGAVLGGELTLEDEDGHKISDEDHDPGLLLAGGVRF